MNSFIIFRENQEYGPYSLETLKSFVEAGNVSEADYARVDGSTDWSTVGVFLSQHSIPPPVPVAFSTVPIRVAVPVRIASTPPPVPSWYYSANGERLGPATDANLSALIADGTLNNKSLVWREGFAGWVPIEQTILKQTPKVPPPLTGAAVSNGIVWLIAFLPLVGSVVRGFLSGLLDTTPDQIIGVGFGVMVANILLAYFDDGRLKKAGYETKNFGGWAWLIPVYLYRRAKALDQSLSYFIAWMICFFVSVLL